MSKVLIVGHPSSKYEFLEKILHKLGMKQPLPSYTHRLSAREITQKLLKASSKTDSPNNTNLAYQNKNLPTHKKRSSKHNQGRLHSLNQSFDKQDHLATYETKALVYQQKNIPKIWDNLAFDLIMANVEQDFWGWSDSSAISALQYWAEFDDDLVFVLTYDRPLFLLESLFANEDLTSIDESKIFAALQDWQEYNQALLQFYQTHSHRCILVNGEQVIDSVDDYLQSIAQKIDSLSISVQNSNNLDFEIIKADEKFSTPKVFDFFIDQILHNDQNSLNLFATMQKNAHVALIETKKQNNLAFTLDLLKEIVHQQSQLLDDQAKIDLLKQTVAQQEQAEEQLKNQFKNTENKLKEQINQLNQEKQQIEQKNKSNEAENQLLIDQLHKVQEKLEQYHQQNQAQKSETVNQTHAKQKELDELKKQLNDLQKSKQALDKQLLDQKNQAQNKVAQLENDLKKQKAVAQRNDELKQENELLIHQLHHVQEKLESYHLQIQQLKQSHEKKSDEDYKEIALSQNNINNQNKHPAIYYGAAERIKQDLPYRLGSTMVKRSKNPKDLATLPFALMKEYRAFQKSQAEHPLPPLESYQDAQEAEKVKRHLSYKLGKVVVDGVKSPKKLIGLPSDIGQEVIEFWKK